MEILKESQPQELQIVRTYTNQGPKRGGPHRLDTGILLTPYDPEIERALAIAAWVARKYRNALRELAK